MRKDKINAGIAVLVIIVLFMFASYLAQTYSDEIKELIGNSILGVILYLMTTIIATVIAPISATPLLPIAVFLWGWFWAAILSIFGWTIGALIAFWLARKYGVPLIKKFIPFKRLQKIADKIPQENIFWSVVFLRMVLPVDLLSYALGLFSSMSVKSYILATIIGIAPFAFVLAYLGELPFTYQITAFMIGLMIFLFGVLIALVVKARKSKILKGVYL